MKYRKKPVVIEATQWFKNGDHPRDYAEDRPRFTPAGAVETIPGAECRRLGMEGEVIRFFPEPDESACKHCGVRMHEHGWIDTLEGGHIVCPGDFIVTGVRGERYPVKPWIFWATYEQAEEPSPAAEAKVDSTA